MVRELAVLQRDCPKESSELVERIDLRLGNAKNGSMLIHGPNDKALDAIGASLNGQVKCIYIDPPYNNMESYTHYDDRDGHDEWIKKLTNHARRLKTLLTKDGSIWISIDDYQMHYLKVALDSVFGRENFVSTIVWEHRKSRENRKVFSNNHEYVLVYARDAKSFKEARNRLPYDDEVLKRYKNPDDDPRGPWQSISLNVQAGHATKNQFYTILAPGGRKHVPPNGRCWMYSAERVEELVADNRIWFGKNQTGVPRLKRFLSEIKGGLTPHTLWNADDVGTTETAKKDLLSLFPDVEVFDTPKPESLIMRILEIATNPGDLVLDSFLGSGTTAAVALRSGRRFIGIEQGDHIRTHCHRRIKPLAKSATATVHFYELK